MIADLQYLALTAADNCTIHALEELWWQGIRDNNALIGNRYALAKDAAARSAHFRRVLQGEETIVFVAAKASKPIGFVVGTLRDESSPLLEPRKLACPSFLAVDKGYRGQGVGSQLMRMFETWAKSKRSQEITFFGFAKNLPAAHMFERLGYEVVSCEFSKRIV